MAKYIISNNKKINGKIKISGSKNSSLPILAAGLLSNEDSTFYEIPLLSDTKNMCELLNIIGGNCVRNPDNSVTVSMADNQKIHHAPIDIVGKLRASFLVMGPLLAKYGKVRIPMPGGCQIGARPIDLHLKGFSMLGAKIKQGHGYVEAKCDKLIGNTIYLDFPSVGATENIMLASSLAEGETIIKNAAAEPEITDLADCLIKMGAEIYGAGSDTIKVLGKESLKGCTHTIIPDRIEAGTFLIMAAAARGELTLENVNPCHVTPVIAKLEEMGFKLEINENSLHIYPKERFKPVDIKTMPYPGFPTDMQSQFMSLISLSEGTGVIIETVFENRFMQVPELLRMGAKIKIDGRTAVIDGTKKLSGAQVKATDLRAGAALLTAALAADGDTVISEIEHMERGYENLVEKLTSVGVNIRRVE